MKITYIDKTVIITGCNGHLGAKFSKSFMNLGAYVIGIDRHNKAKINSDNFKYYKINIADHKQIKYFYNTLKKKNIAPNILINNAGLSYKGKFELRKQNEINEMLIVNLAGTYNMINEYYKIAKIGSNIVNISSIYGFSSPKPELYIKNKKDNSETYGATKAGIIQMSKYFARYLSSKKIRVNSVSPGGILTKENKIDKYFINKYISDVPLKRLAKIEDIVSSVIFLASEEASYINGHNLVIDGGKTC